MYDFRPTAEEQEVLAKASVFMDQYVYPNEKYFVPHRGLPDDLLKQLQQKIKELGLWAGHMPKDVGGMGMGYVALGLLSEVIGRSPIAPYIFGTMAPESGNSEILLHAGTAEQKHTYLLPLVNGDIRSCFAMTEPEVSGSDPTLLRTRAESDGEYWIINGNKWFTTGASGASFTIVMALSEPDALPHERYSMFIVDLDNPGFKVIRETPTLGDQMTGGHCEVYFSDCRIPLKNILGRRGEGFKLAQLRLGPGRITHAMRWVGVARRSLDLMVNYTKNTAKNSKTTVEMETMQNLIADSATEIEAARLMTLYAAWKMDQGDQARKEISMIKLFGAKILNDVIDRAMQIHGMAGLAADFPLESFYREARAARIYDGADEVHRMVIARQVIKEFGKRK
jgi:alkylation response protein AidB-like acyl-CoA dehydrogenase